MNALTRTSLAGSVRSRSLWILIDQGISSGYGLLVGVAAAQVLDRSDFAVYATLFSFYLVGRGAARALALEPLLIKRSVDSDEQAAASATGVSLSVGLVTGVAAVGLTLLTDTFNLEAALAFLAAVMFLLWIDALRTRAIARARPDLAVVVDLLLLALGLVAFGVGRYLGMDSPATLFGAIAISATVAVVGCERRVPALNLVDQRQWWHRARPLAWPLLLEFLTNTGTSTIAVFLLAAIEFEDAGSMRAAQLVAAPVFTLNLGLAQLVLVEGLNLRWRGARIVVRFGRIVLLGMMAAGVAYWAIVVAWLGEVQVLLGATGPSARTVIVPLVLAAVLTGPSFAAGSTLRALGQVNQLLAARLLATAPLLAAVVAGAVLDGARGVAVWSVGAQLLTVPIWWIAERRGAGAAERRRHEAKGVDHGS